MKQEEDNYKKAHALLFSLGNLALLLLGPRYWMPSVYLIQYSVGCTETPGKSFLPLRKRNGANVQREAGQGGARPLLHHGHSSIYHLFSFVSPLYHKQHQFLSERHSSLRDTAASETQQPSDTAASETQQPSDTAASETQQPQRHSSRKSSTLISNFSRSRTSGINGRGLSISLLLTIAVQKFQLWNLFCAAAWNRNVGAVPNFAQW